ncbi:DUF3137 domain-containing protein [Kribbella sp. NPDC056345]|uniref:DUF3137 domain-containing protein n=1 Tax=Kribbella sp. NPDC056345 TaxID=3345789 RepID=UPI0035D74373
MLILVGGVAIIVVRRRRRRAAIRRRAAVMGSHGWALAPAEPSLVALAGRLTIRGRATQMFTGDFRGRELRVLDYEFTARRGPAPVHLIALTLPVALPQLTVSKDSALPGRDFELESQSFNEQFRVQADDQRFASAVLQPRLMEWMLQNPDLRWHLAGNALVSWGYGEVAPTDILARLEAMAGVIDRIPPFVLTDYGVS